MHYYEPEVQKETRKQHWGYFTSVIKQREILIKPITQVVKIL